MRTRTIFEAYTGARAIASIRKMRQQLRFRDELLRRMDERDALVAWRPRCTTIADLEAFGRSIAVNVNAGDAAGGDK